MEADCQITDQLSPNHGYTDGTQTSMDGVKHSVYKNETESSDESLSFDLNEKSDCNLMNDEKDVLPSLDDKLFLTDDLTDDSSDSATIELTEIDFGKFDDETITSVLSDVDKESSKNQDDDKKEVKTTVELIHSPDECINKQDNCDSDLEILEIKQSKLNDETEATVDKDIASRHYETSNESNSSFDAHESKSPKSEQLTNPYSSNNSSSSSNLKSFKKRSQSKSTKMPRKFTEFDEIKFDNFLQDNRKIRTRSHSARKSTSSTKQSSNISELNSTTGIYDRKISDTVNGISEKETRITKSKSIDNVTKRKRFEYNDYGDELEFPLYLTPNSKISRTIRLSGHKNEERNNDYVTVEGVIRRNTQMKMTAEDSIQTTCETRVFENEMGNDLCFEKDEESNLKMMSNQTEKKRKHLVKLNSSETLDEAGCLDNKTSSQIDKTNLKMINSENSNVKIYHCSSSKSGTILSKNSHSTSSILPYDGMKPSKLSDLIYFKGETLFFCKYLIKGYIKSGLVPTNIARKEWPDLTFSFYESYHLKETKLKMESESEDESIVKSSPRKRKKLK